MTDAVFDAGFASASRFYESADKLPGMKPADYRKGRRGETIQFAFGRSDWAMIIVATTSRAACCAVEFGDTEAALHRKRLAARFPQSDAGNGRTNRLQWRGRVQIAIIRSNQPNAALAFTDVRGTAFQHQVWKSVAVHRAGSTARVTAIWRKRSACLMGGRWRRPAQNKIAGSLAIA